ncbi:MAG TPA: hypothetical protein VNB94_10055 [Mycobacteriales bacterium]|nr:hypothetical protein [Mycobacteriales bacterium]
MGESYVRPVTRAREPEPTWLPVLRFRIVVILLLALIAWGALEVFRRYVDPNRSQDPGIGDETNLVETPNALPGGRTVLLPY